MSNLPPGVSAHMIPGNRPTDMQAELVAEDLHELVERYGVDTTGVMDDPRFDIVLSFLLALISENRKEVE